MLLSFWWKFIYFSAIYDASCTWRGQLPPRSHNNKTLSCKVFLGGVPWDITESNLIQAFRPYGNIRIEWPGKDSSSIPKGYLYIIFEHEKQVRSLLSACTQDFGNGGGSWYFKVSSLKIFEFLHFFEIWRFFRCPPREWETKRFKLFHGWLEILLMSVVRLQGWMRTRPCS